MAVGRNRAFSPEQAVETAMTTFWQRGFNGTSLSDLTTSMGINKSSLYSTFKSKESLFISAVTHYSALYGKPYVEVLFDTTEHDPVNKIQRYLQTLADLVTSDTCPPGCLITNSTCEINDGTLPQAATEAIMQLNQRTKESFVLFFANEIENGTLAGNESAQSLADYLMSLQFGLAVMAKNGTSKASLAKVIDLGLRTFSK